MSAERVTIKDMRDYLVDEELATFERLRATVVTRKRPKRKKAPVSALSDEMRTRIDSMARVVGYEKAIVRRTGSDNGAYRATVAFHAKARGSTEDHHGKGRSRDDAVLDAAKKTMLTFLP